MLVCSELKLPSKYSAYKCFLTRKALEVYLNLSVRYRIGKSSLRSSMTYAGGKAWQFQPQVVTTNGPSLNIID